MPALNSGHTVSKISHPQLDRSFCHELTVYAVACGNGFPADGRTDLFTPENTGVNAKIIGRFSPFLMSAIGH